MNLCIKLAVILGMTALLSCSAYPQTSKKQSTTVTIRDQDVLDVFSSRVAVVQYQGEKCLYDIRNGLIVERNVTEVRHDDGYLLSLRSTRRYTLYSGQMEVVRTWEADSSRLLSDGAVAVKGNGQWSVISNVGKIIHTSKQGIIRASFPYVVIDSSRVLINTVTGDMLKDSVLLFFRWGHGIIVGRDSSETSSYYWYSAADNRLLDLGTEIVWATQNSIVFRDSRGEKTVYDTNMTVLCHSPNRVLECGKFLRVEYSYTGETWCFIDLVGSDTRCGYDDVVPDGNGCYIVSKDRQWGLLRYDGKVIIPISHPILPDKSRNTHVQVVSLPNYRGDNVIKFYTNDWQVSYYYYDINRYSKLFAE